MPVARPHAALQAGPQPPTTPDSSPARQRPAVAILGPRPALLNVEEVCFRHVDASCVLQFVLDKHHADVLQAFGGVYHRQSHAVHQRVLC